MARRNNIIWKQTVDINYAHFNISVNRDMSKPMEKNQARLLTEWDLVED